MKFLPVLIGVLLLGCASMDVEPVAEQTVFDRVCESMEVDCSDVTPPIIVYTQLVDELPCYMCTYNGLAFDGEPYVFVNSMKSEEQQSWTAFHETVHYVVFQKDIPLTRCENEMVARKLTALEFNFEYDDEWLERYRCNADGTDMPPPETVELPEEIIRIIEIIVGE